MADTGNTIGVTPDKLREVSPQFRRASQATYDLISSLDQATQSVLSDMYSAQLTHFPDALDHSGTDGGPHFPISLPPCKSSLIISTLLPAAMK